MSGDKYKFPRQKSNNLISLQHITLLHRAFINALSKLPCIHMHFIILFGVTFVCVCAHVEGHECICLWLCVCVCALYSFVHKLINSEGKAGPVHQIYCIAPRFISPWGTEQQCVHFRLTSYQRFPSKRENTHLLGMDTVKSYTDKSLKLTVSCCSPSQTLLKDSCAMSAKCSIFLLLTRCQMVCINSEWFR